MKFIALIITGVFALTGATATAAAETGRQTTAALFAQQFPLTRSVLRADFPQDLAVLEQEFAAIDDTEISPQLKTERVFLSLTALRKKYAPQLRFARSDLSSLVALSLADFYRSVFERDGSAVCGGFAVDGAGTLYTIGAAPAYGVELDRQGASYFAAVASAFEDPDVLEPASEDDWKELMGQIVADGHPPSYLASIATPKIADPDLCPALSAFFQVMAEAKSDAVRRARAEFIQNVTGY